MNKTDKPILVGERISIYPRGKKKIYNATFWHAGKHCRRTLGTRNAKIARQRALELDRRIFTGTSVSPSWSESGIQLMSVEQAVTDFIEYKITEGCRRKTIVKYRGMLELFKKFVSERNVQAMSEITLLLIDKFQIQRRQAIAATSLHNEGVMLKTFLYWCKQRKLIAENPLEGVNYKRPRKEPRGGPSLQQVNEILANASEIRFPVLAVLAFTGMRSGECRNLRPG